MCYVLSSLLSINNIGIFRSDQIHIRYCTGIYASVCIFLYCAPFASDWYNTQYNKNTWNHKIYTNIIFFPPSFVCIKSIQSLLFVLVTTDQHKPCTYSDLPIPPTLSKHTHTSYVYTHISLLAFMQSFPFLCAIVVMCLCLDICPVIIKVTLVFRWTLVDFFFSSWFFYITVYMCVFSRI